MTTHARLTEGSLRAHPRKGREGKGREQGREARERLHHIVTLVDARVRDGVVVALTRPMGVLAA